VSVYKAKHRNPQCCCTNIVNFSAHAARICTVQFPVAFQSATSGLESAGFKQQQSWKKLSRAALFTGNWH